MAVNFVPGMMRSVLAAMPLIAAASTESAAAGCGGAISWLAVVVSPVSQRVPAAAALGASLPRPTGCLCGTNRPQVGVHLPARVG